MTIQYLPVNGHTYSTGADDEGIGVRYLDNGGHWDNLIPLFNDALTVIGSQVDAVEAISGGVITSSTSPVTLGTGSKTLTVDMNMTIFGSDAWVRVHDITDSSLYMIGQVVSYNSGTGSLVLTVVNSNGTGSYANWVVRSLGERGPTGPAGTTIYPFIKQTRNSNIELLNAHSGYFLQVTASITQTITSVDNLSANWFCWVYNVSDSTLTVNPAGSETINGVEQLTINKGDLWLILKETASFLAVAIQLGPTESPQTHQINQFLGVI
jgi:hypothetical protein